MIEIFRSKYGLRIREIYFADKIQFERQPTDIDVYVQSSTPFKHSKKFYTSIIDLSSDEDQLFKDFSRSCKYDIRRAIEKDNLTFSFTNTPNSLELSNFINFYDEFAALKKIKVANRKKLEILKKNKNISISSISKSTDPHLILAMHCYIFDDKRYRLLLSATNLKLQSESKDNQLIGRANKLLHWEDMKIIKKKNIKNYDMGGVTLNGHLKGIDNFKLQFGGKTQLEYNKFNATSVLGNLILKLYGLLQYLNLTH